MNTYFHIISQDKQKELLDTNWRTVEFHNGELLLSNGSAIYMCVRALDDDDTCNYSICENCKAEHQSRGRFSTASRSDCRKSCHHQIRNLQMNVEPYWCGRNYIHGSKWKNKPQGCVCCKKKYVASYLGK